MDFLSTLTLAAESADKIQETVNATMFNVGDGNGIWYLIGAALVFFMQCGFAMVETGFTRAKNAGNNEKLNGLLPRYDCIRASRLRSDAWRRYILRTYRCSES